MHGFKAWAKRYVTSPIYQYKFLFREKVNFANAMSLCQWIMMYVIGTVHATLGALFLWLGLPFTLIRLKNAALFLWLGLPFTLIRHENAALFLWLGLPFTLIRHENGTFQRSRF